MLFQNRAVKRFSVRIKETSNCSIIDECEALNKTQEQFALVDFKDIFNSEKNMMDYALTIKRIKDCKDFWSL